MAKLSAAEQKALDKLIAKSEAPDTSPSSRAVSFSVDLGDEKQVGLARRLGLIDDSDDDDDAGDDDEGGDDEDGTPKRRGYFADKDK